MSKPRYHKGQVLIHKIGENEPVKVVAIRSPEHRTSYAPREWHYDVSSVVGSIPQSHLRLLTAREKGQ